ncbi:hypothetical protein [Porphyromonas gingivicanis]|uniref:hypothetical protein n=1 Tax=Porphyromonas gingivicanis TaxID=266762 RepID=UPI0011DD3CE4|nr:hypothetical protein [Porphyromonas gingivicanis]
MGHRQALYRLAPPVVPPHKRKRCKYTTLPLKSIIAPQIITFRDRGAMGRTMDTEGKRSRVRGHRTERR